MKSRRILDLRKENWDQITLKQSLSLNHLKAMKFQATIIEILIEKQQARVLVEEIKDR